MKNSFFFFSGFVFPFKSKEVRHLRLVELRRLVVMNNRDQMYFVDNDNKTNIRPKPNEENFAKKSNLEFDQGLEHHEQNA